MAIVKMKRVKLLALQADRSSILSMLQKEGCVQIDETKPAGDSGLVRLRTDELSEWRTRHSTVKAALEALQKLAGAKRSMLSPRPEVELDRFLSSEHLEQSLETAGEICGLSRKITALNSETGRLQNRLATLSPWLPLDIPLDIRPLPSLDIAFGVIPAQAGFEELKTVLASEAGLSEAFYSASDAESQYICVVSHPSARETVQGVLKSFGFSRMTFKDVQGSPREVTARIEARMAEIEREKSALAQGVADFAARREDLELACDTISTRCVREVAAGKLLSTDSAFYLEGWIDAPSVDGLTRRLSDYACATEFLEPSDEDEPPVLLRNSKLISPFNMVTKMYGLPKYRNIDPNPLISVFYAVFFGMMFADIAYGAVLLAISLYVTKKLKPKGPTVRYMFPLMGICGVASILWGVIYGSFFSDIIERIGITYFGAPSDFSLKFGPYKLIDQMQGDGAVTILVIAVALGAVHLITGMAIKFYILCRDGKPLDAVMDVGSWWLLFAGIAVLALGGTPWVMVAGFAALILTQGRHSKSVLGKLFGGIASLYDLTGYLSDILSYSRLMALGLAGGVLGSVFNTMGGMLGGAFLGTENPVLWFIGFVAGLALFIAVFAFGHAFNMAINVIGTYVHAARLQYIEYFGKFYDSGGKEFAPLEINTKYVDIV